MNMTRNTLTLLHTSQTEEDKTSMRMKRNKKCCIIERFALQSHFDFDFFLHLLTCLAFPFRVRRGDLDCFVRNRIKNEHLMLYFYYQTKMPHVQQ